MIVASFCGAQCVRNPPSEMNEIAGTHRLATGLDRHIHNLLQAMHRSRAIHSMAGELLADGQLKAHDLELLLAHEVIDCVPRVGGEGSKVDGVVGRCMMSCDGYSLNAYPGLPSMRTRDNTGQ